MSWTSVLVPLDGSDFAREALPCGEHIARRDGARLRLVAVHPGLPPGPGGTVPEALTGADRRKRESRREALEALAGELRERGLKAEAEVLSGPVVEELARRAGESADLVVMATHGRGPLSRLWLGSVADGLVRSSPVPVLLVRPRDDDTDGEAPGSGGFHRVLVPLDGSARARRAVEPAARLLDDPAGALILLRVVVPVTLTGLGPADVPSGVDVSATEAMEEEAEQRLDETARKVGERLGLAVESRVVRHPHPAEAVLRAVSETEADAAAVATHGRGGLQRVLLGSVADKVVRGARTPVLVVRPGDGER